jgi:hypothetical protein
LIESRTGMVPALIVAPAETVIDVVATIRRSG